jgi:cell division protein FtsB
MKIGRYVFILIMFISYFILFGNKGALDNYRMKKKIEAERQANAHIIQENENLTKEILLLRDDPRYIEMVARRDLGMVKKGDHVFRFANPQPHANPPDGAAR